MNMIFGIAGYMGSGKTFAGQYLLTLGAEFIEADLIVTDLYKKNRDGFRKIVNYLGKEYLDSNGEVDRKKLAKYAFSSETHLQILNQLIHPLVKNVIKGLIADKKDKIVFIEAVEFDRRILGTLVDGIVWIDVDPDLIADRLQKERRFDGIMRKKVLSLQKRLKEADYVIKNDGTKAEFQESLKSLYEELRKKLL